MPRQCEQSFVAVSKIETEPSFALPSPTDSCYSVCDALSRSSVHSYQSSTVNENTHELSASSTPPPVSYHGSNWRSGVGSPSRLDIAHPYARLYAKKEGGKRRKIWNHALEKSLFSPYELSTVGAPHRRTIYMASLEAHIDRLHAQLLSIGFWPVAFDELEPFKGLNSKTAKSMVAGLQHDASHARLKLLELERANDGLRETLRRPEVIQNNDACHSPDLSYPAPCAYSEP